MPLGTVDNAHVYDGKLRVKLFMPSIAIFTSLIVLSHVKLFKCTHLQPVKNHIKFFYLISTFTEKS